MESIDELKKSLKTSTDVKKIVSTMKAIAATNIKRYEKAAKSLNFYTQNVKLGIKGLLDEDKASIVASLKKEKHEGKTVIVGFGSNQGLCGRFNGRVVDLIQDFLERKKISLSQTNIVTIGDRLATYLDASGMKSRALFATPNSLEIISDTVQRILLVIDQIRRESGVKRVVLVYLKYRSGSMGINTTEEIFPINLSLFKELEEEGWPRNQKPMHRGDAAEMLSFFIKQLLFTSIYEALAMSMASEQANRLNTLQAAETNIGEIIEDTQKLYNQKRQTTITSELLDVVSGYKALKKMQSK